MITKLSIRSFKSLAEVELTLGNVNVFVGANGTGKSNLLEAVGILGAAAQGRIDSDNLLRRGVRPGIPRLYKTAFGDAPASNTITFEATGTEASYKAGIFAPDDSSGAVWRYFSENLMSRGVRVVGRSPANTNQLDQTLNLNADAGYAALKAVELLADDPGSRLLADLRNFAVFAPNTPTLRGLIADSVPREPMGLGGGNLADAFDELLDDEAENNPAFDVLDDVLPLVDWIDDVETVARADAPVPPGVPNVGKSALLFHDRYMKRTLTSADASEGALYVIFAAVMAAHPGSPRIFAIDNFDHGLNPRLAKALTHAFSRWCIHFNRQALLTAHSPQVLDGLPLDDDKVKLFALDRTSRGRTVVKDIDLALVREKKAERPEATLSSLWLSGVLGGMPNV